MKNRQPTPRADFLTCDKSPRIKILKDEIEKKIIKKILKKALIKPSKVVKTCEQDHADMIIQYKTKHKQNKV
jgi:hypothetical protein